MKEEVYRILKENAHSHWWNTSKDAIVIDLIKTLDIPPDGNIVDLGTGTGYFLSRLEFKNRYGIDNYRCESSYDQFRFIQADINQMPLKENSADLILMLDVLEHMKDDKKVIEDCLKVLKVNGKLLLFVPALQILWSDLDRLGMHFRRYSAKNFKKMLAEISIPHRIIKSSYVNFSLFPFIFFIRIAQAFLKRFREDMPTHNLEKPNEFINKTLRYIFSSERFFLRFMDFPIGTSYICVLEKA